VVTQRAGSTGPTAGGDLDVGIREGRWYTGLDALVAALLAAGVLVVHDVPYLVGHPFWLDESWVAVSTRAPLVDLPNLTGPSPLGWTVLLRWVPGSGEQRERLVPLAFAALTVAAAYYLGRELRLARVPAGILTAGAALFVPSMLVRDDLKQYTADAFVAVVIVLLVARLESAWSGRRLAVLCGAVPAGMALSHTAVVVGVSALLAVALAQVAAREWVRLRDAAAGGALSCLAAASYFLAFDRRHENPSLKAYWRNGYLPGHQGARALAATVHTRLAAVAPLLGLGPVLVAITLVSLGIATLAVLRRTATALVTPLVCVALLVGGLTREYPFLDARTSTFLLVLLAVVAAIGVAGLSRLVARRSTVGALAVAALASAMFVHGAWPSVRSHRISLEDVRSQVRYVDAHRRPGDVLVVSVGASYSYAYYEPWVRPEFRVSDVSNGFSVALPASTGVVLAGGPLRPAIVAALDEARQLTATGRLWVIRAHQSSTENRAWLAALRGERPLLVGVGALLLAASPATTPHAPRAPG
jgi:hypothetical protein